MRGVCPDCDGTGFVVDETTNTARDCHCRPRRINEAKTRRLEARIPKKYRDVAFDRFPVTEIPDFIVRDVRAFVRRIDENVEQGRGVWFVGPTATGKTTLAMLVSKAALEAGRSVAIYSVPRLLGLIRDAIRSDDGMLHLIDQLTSVDLLHLDDLGAESTTDWVLEQLYTIVNTRYEEERSVIVTTNLYPDQLREQIGARTVSRIVEICGDPIPLEGRDRRVEYRPAG